jgi:hypothetical protein
MIDFNDGTNIKIYTGHPTSGYVIEQNASGYTDMGDAISCYIVFRNFDGDNPVRMKKARKVFITDIYGSNDATFNYRYNNATTWTTPSEITNKDDVRKFYLLSTKWRYYQPKLSYSVSGKTFGLSGIETYFKLKKAK